MIQTGQRSTMNGGEKILGVEGGGTKTAWVLVERAGNELCVLDQGKLPPANLRLATPGELQAIFSELPKEITSAGIFLAGCGTEYDLHRGEVQFTTKVLRALSLNNLDELVRWAQTADKMEIAMLTPVVFEAAASGDSRVMEIIEEGARVLCEYTEAVATRLHALAPKVVLLGGLFQRDSIYNHAFRRRLKKTLPDTRVANSERAPEFGAAWLAAELQSSPELRTAPAPRSVDRLAAALTDQ